MTDFRIRVIVDPAAAVAGAKKVEQQLGRTEGAADRLQKTLFRAFAGLGILVLARQLTELADSFTNIQNRLRTVVEGEQELVDVTQRLFDISNKTRSSFEGTAEVFARVGLSARELGRDQSELLDFTESLNQAVILSGASAQEAGAGLIQLSQGLASGALRGDELRSVLEQLPVVADIIAKSLNVTRGELRQLGADGKITADIVLNAFKEAREELNERFAKSVPTIGQAFVVLKNSIISAVGSFNEATGASEGVSRAILAIAKNVRELAAVLVIAGSTFAAVKLSVLAAGAAEVVANFVKLKLAVLQGTAVVLGSAEATRQQAAATLAAAAADAERTAATIASIEAERARSVVSIQATAGYQAQVQAEVVAAAARVRTAQVTLAATQAENARLLASTEALAILQAASGQEAALAAARTGLSTSTAALAAAQAELAASVTAANTAEAAQAAVEGQLASLKATLTAQTAAQTAAEGRLAAATAATTLRYKLLNQVFKVNPFILLVTGTVAAIAILKKFGETMDEIRSIKDEADKGEFLALTEFGKVGEQIRKVTNEVERLQGLINRDVDAGRVANPAAVRALEQAKVKLAALADQQDYFRQRTDAAKDAARRQREELEALDTAFNRTKASLEQESRLLQLNSHEREVQADLLKLIAQIQKEGGPELSQGERDALENLVRRNHALEEQAAILDSLETPQAQFQRGFDSLSKLLQAGQIDLETFNRKLVEFAADANGLDIEGLTISLPGATDFEDITARLTALLNKQKELAEVESVRKQVLQDIRGPVDELIARQDALNNLLNRGKITQLEYNEEMAKTQERLRLLNPEYARQQALLQELNGPTEELKLRQQDLNRLYFDGAITAQQYAEETRKVKEALNPLTKEQQLQKDLYDQIKGPQEEFRLKTAALGALFAQGKITLSEYNKAMEELRSKNEELGTSFGDGITSGLKKVGEQMNDIASLSEATLVNAFNSAEDALVEFATTGQFSFQDFAMSILKDIARIIARLLILQAIQAVTGTGGAPSSAGTAATGSAHGGPVHPFEKLLVGEKGPEMFIPGTAGTIIPAGQTAQAMAGAGGGTTVVQAPAPNVKLNVINVDSPESARDAMDTEEGAKVIMNQVRRNRSAIRRELG